jgi:replication factor C subunit 2/4
MSYLGKVFSTIKELRSLTFCVRYRVEKYRPVFLDDVVGNTETIERLKIIAKDGNMPHVIISGMPGIGKTTSVLCLARQLLGDAYKEAVLELNASDERGRSTISLLMASN